MMLLNSIWLFALGALSIPIAIHLWNVQQGKTLKVGSISLINFSLSKRSRSLKLHDILLLILRCLLLALLAFVLAMPFIRQKLDGNTKGWLLIPKENITESYQKFKPQIDSLTKAGYSFHYFNKGFQKADLNKILQNTSITRHTNLNKGPYWSLVQQLDGQLPSDMPVYLFTSNGVSHFDGDKPQIALNLKWKTYTATDSVTTWIQNAWFTSNNDVSVTQGTSKPSGTYFTRFLVKSGNEQSTPFHVSVNNGKAQVNIKNTCEGIIQTAVDIDTSILHYTVFADKNSPDAGYVIAALKAVAEFTQHKTIIKQYNNAGQIPARQDWVFWLSDKPVDKNIINNSSNILNYESGKAVSGDSWIGSNNSIGQGRQQIPLYKLISVDKRDEQLIWRDGFGRPVLSLQEQPYTHIYHFYSRFDPAWNDLVWNDDFPKMLLKLVTGQRQVIRYDNRAMDARQLQPEVDNEKHAGLGKSTMDVNLSHYFWLLLIFALVTERWLAHRQKILQNG